MILGGVPEYLQKASEYTDPGDFIEKEFTNKYGYFYKEPLFLISQELKEMKIYFSILNAIAGNYSRPSEISGFIGMETRKIYP